MAGSGAFSVVVKGKHKETNEVYAVKIVDKNSTGHQEMYDEINMMSMLSHDNIVNFKEIFNRRDGYYVILECASPLFHALASDFKSLLVVSCLTALSNCSDIPRKMPLTLCVKLYLA